MIERLAAAVAATRQGISASDTRSLSARGWDALIASAGDLRPIDREAAESRATELTSRGVQVMCLADRTYPARVRALSSPPPFLFCLGDLALLETPGVAFSGSRNASGRALIDAQEYARMTVALGRQVIAGNAKGVDLAAHVAALRSGGSTTLVFSEGIEHLRKSGPVWRDEDGGERILIVSEFPPGQRWSAGSAMARNRTILALAGVLLVIEAGSTGGTLDAGRRALRTGLPVAVVDAGGETAPGSVALISDGALALRTVDEFGDWVRQIDNPLEEQYQLRLDT